MFIDVGRAHVSFDDLSKISEQCTSWPNASNVYVPNTGYMQSAKGQRVSCGVEASAIDHIIRGRVLSIIRGLLMSVTVHCDDDQQRACNHSISGQTWRFRVQQESSRSRVHVAIGSEYSQVVYGTELSVIMSASFFVPLGLRAQTRSSQVQAVSLGFSYYRQMLQSYSYTPISICCLLRRQRTPESFRNMLSLLSIRPNDHSMAQLDDSSFGAIKALLKKVNNIYSSIWLAIKWFIER